MIRLNGPDSNLGEDPFSPDFQAIFESLPSACLIIAPDFRLLAVTDVYLRLTHRKREEILGRNIFDVFPGNPADLKGGGERDLRSSLETILRTGQNHVMGVVKYDIVVERESGSRYEDRYWQVVNTPSLDPEGHVKLIFHTVEDVTASFVGEQQHLERERDLEQQIRESRLALRASESSLRLIVEGTTDHAIFMLDLAGNVVTWNAGAARIFGFAPEEIIGQSYSILYNEDDSATGIPASNLRQAAMQGRFEEDQQRRRKDGSKFLASMVITSLHDTSGSPKGFSCVSRDVTQKKEEEASARRVLEAEAARLAAEEQAEIIWREREKLRVTLQSIGDGGDRHGPRWVDQYHQSRGSILDGLGRGRGPGAAVGRRVQYHQRGDAC